MIIIISFPDYSIPKAASSDAEVSLVQKVGLFGIGDWCTLIPLYNTCSLPSLCRISMGPRTIVKFSL